MLYKDAGVDIDEDELDKEVQRLKNESKTLGL